MLRRTFFLGLGAGGILSGCSGLQSSSRGDLRDPSEGIVVRQTPRRSAAMTNLMPDGDAIFLSGTINEDTAVAFNTVRKANPSVRRVVFLNAEGAAGGKAGMALGRAIRTAGLRTHLRNDSKITGGAIDAYIGGTERTLEQGAVVAAARVPSGAETAHAAFVTQMLGTDGYANYVRNFARNRPRPMTIAELGAMGLVSGTAVDMIGPGFIVQQG